MLTYSISDNEYSLSASGLKMFLLTQNTVKYWTDYTTGNDEIEIVKYGENRCKYAEAEKEVVNLLDRMGFSNMEVVYSCQVISVSQEQSDCLDGYIMTCGPSVGRIKSGCTQSMSVNGDENLFSPQFYMFVHVNSKGIQYIGTRAIYDTKEKLSDSITMLDFEQIDSTAQQYIKDLITGLEQDPQIPQDYGYIHNIDRIELRYVTLTYDGDMYSFAPVWLYFDSSAAYVENEYALFGVNAIDGCIISNVDTKSSMSDPSLMLEYRED